MHVFCFFLSFHAFSRIEDKNLWMPFQMQLQNFNSNRILHFKLNLFLWLHFFFFCFYMQNIYINPLHMMWNAHWKLFCHDMGEMFETRINYDILDVNHWCWKRVKENTVGKWTACKIKVHWMCFDWLPCKTYLISHFMQWACFDKYRIWFYSVRYFFKIIKKNNIKYRLWNVYVFVHFFHLQISTNLRVFRFEPEKKTHQMYQTLFLWAINIDCINWKQQQFTS